MTAPNMELRRAPQAQPSKPGWYYGYAPNAITPQIIPWLVLDYDGELRIVIPEFGNFPLKHYKWFGPVPTCVESCAS